MRVVTRQPWRHFMTAVVYLVCGQSACTCAGWGKNSDDPVVSEALLLDMRGSGPRDVSGIMIDTYSIRFDAYVAGKLGRVWNSDSEALLRASPRARRLGAEELPVDMVITKLPGRLDKVEVQVTVDTAKRGTVFLEFRPFGVIFEAFKDANYDIANPETLPTLPSESMGFGLMMFLLTTDECAHVRGVEIAAGSDGRVTSWALEFTEPLSAERWTTVVSSVESSQFQLFRSGEETVVGRQNLQAASDGPMRMVLRPETIATGDVVIKGVVPKSAGLAGMFFSALSCEAADWELKLNSFVMGEQRIFYNSPFFEAREAAFPEAKSP